MCLKLKPQFDAFGGAYSTEVARNLNDYNFRLRLDGWKQYN